MRKHYFLGAILVIAWVATPAVMAQTTPPADNTDMTHYIVNPGFEIDGAYTNNGWQLEASNPNGAGFNIPADYSEQECWNATIDFYQEITGLPEGIYRLTVQGFYVDGAFGNDVVADDPEGRCVGAIAHDDGRETIGTELYCQTSVRTKTDPFVSLYAQSEAGSGGRNGAVVSMATARTAFDNGFFINVVDGIFVGSDGKLRIGARSIANTFASGSWTIWDNFTLHYVREAGLDGYRELADMVALEIASYPASYSGALKITNEVIDRIGAGDNWGDTAEEIIATRNELEALLDELKAGQIAVAKFETVWEVINSYIDNTEYSGFDALTEVFGQYDGYIDPANPELLYAADIEKAVPVIEAAIRAYRLTQEVEDPAVGLDFTFAITNNRFDNGLDGWTAAGWRTFSDNNTKYIGWETPYTEEGVAEPAVNNVLDAGPNNSVAYQIVPSMPMGYYTLSAVGRGEAIGPADMVLFIGNSTIEQTATFERIGGDGGELEFGFHRVTTGKQPLYKAGDITIGVRLGATGGWESADDFRLTYYGMPTEGSIYEESRDMLLALADELNGSEFLPVQKKYLMDAVAVLEDADISTSEKAEAAFEAFDAVADSVKNAIADFAAFKTTGGFNALVEIANNIDGLYSPELQDFISGIVMDWDEALTNELEEISVTEYEAIKASTILYKAYADAYIAAYNYSALTTIYENAEIINTIINEQTVDVEAHPSRLKPATQILIDVLTYGKSFDDYSSQYEEFVVNETFTVDELASLQTAFTQNMETAVENQTTLPQHTIDMWMPLRKLQQEYITDNDATAWIVNPSFEDGVEDETTAYDRRQEARGWTKTGPANSEFCVRNDAGGRLTNGTGFAYFQNWRNGALPEFKIMQTIYIPNGEYTLTAAGDAASTGFFLVVNGKEIAIGINNDFSVDFDVSKNIATFGVHNKAGSTVGWARADNFRLQIRRLYPDAIENIDADGSLVAYSQNGYIVVEGVENYTVTSIAGIQYPASAKLAAGIYIVTAGNKAAKVVVP